MKIKFSVSFTPNKTIYIKLRVREDEENESLVETKISNIMNALYLEYHSQLDQQRSNLFILPNGSSIIYFKKEINIENIEIIDTMVKIIARKIYPEPNSVICEFLDQCGINNFNLYKNFLSRLSTQSPELYIFYLKHLRNNKPDLLTNLIDSEKNPSKRQLYIFNSLDDLHRFYFISGYMHLENDAHNDITIPKELWMMIMTYTFTNEAPKLFFRLDKSSIHITGGIRTFKKILPQKNETTSKTVIDQQKQHCCIL
jgi:hypothetical protein